MREIQLQLNCIITTIVLLWCPISCVDNDFFYNKAPQRTKGKHITAGVTVYKLLIPVAVLLYVSLEKLTHCSGQMCTFFGGLGHMFALPRYGVNGLKVCQNQCRFAVASAQAALLSPSSCTHMWTPHWTSPPCYWICGWVVHQDKRGCCVQVQVINTVI